MSCVIIGHDITLTRGDSMLLLVKMTKDGEEYTPVGGDRVRFAVKHNVKKPDNSDYIDTEPLILKDIPIESMLLQLDPEDTKSLAFGSYVYDIEIVFADGYVDTFISKATFTLSEEVH